MLVIAGWALLAPLIKPQKMAIIAADGDTMTGDRVSMMDAIYSLESDDAGRMRLEKTYSVHSVTGENFDSSGKADAWIFEITTNDRQFYFIFRNNTFVEYDWKEYQIDPPINMGKLVMPEAILNSHRSLKDDIFGQKDIKRIELQLRNGTYTLTVVKDKPVEYYFNAYTGNVVEKQ